MPGSRSYTSLLKEQTLLIKALRDYEKGGFAHLSDIEQAQVEAGLKRRLSHIEAELREIDETYED